MSLAAAFASSRLVTSTEMYKGTCAPIWAAKSTSLSSLLWSLSRRNSWSLPRWIDYTGSTSRQMCPCLAIWASNKESPSVSRLKKSVIHTTSTSWIGSLSTWLRSVDLARNTSKWCLSACESMKVCTVTTVSLKVVLPHQVSMQVVRNKQFHLPSL